MFLCGFQVLWHGNMMCNTVFFMNFLFLLQLHLLGLPQIKCAYSFLLILILIEIKWEKALRSKCTERITSSFSCNTFILRLPGDYILFFILLQLTFFHLCDGVVQATPNRPTPSSNLRSLFSTHSYGFKYYLYAGDSQICLYGFGIYSWIPEFHKLPDQHLI